MIKTMNKNSKKAKIIVVMPAYNAEKTLKKTYQDIPKNLVDEIILVDDGSQDKTAEISEEIGIKTFTHHRNKGYGASQKTCYDETLKRDPDIIVMLHPDYQYNPQLIPKLIEPILNKKADLVLGSRIMNGKALENGMPFWKYLANRFLTLIENFVLKKNLNEYHTGFRAYSKNLLKTIPYQTNADGFVFDTQIIIQTVANVFQIKEVATDGKYFDDASSVNFKESLKYGINTLIALWQFKLHNWGFKKYRWLSKNQ